MKTIFHRKSAGLFKRNIISFSALITGAVLWVAGWLSTGFCDWYAAHIFPLWVNSYARVTGSVKHSVGEIMLYGSVIFIAIWLIWGLFVLIRRGRGKHVFAKCSRILSGIFSVVFLIMVLNCFLLYHVTPFSERYWKGARDYSVSELVVFRNYIVRNANELGEELPHDEKGYLVLPESEAEIREQAILEMQRLGGTYPELAGYYPQPKPLRLSWFYSQQYILGYYFPFSMEANYNPDMYLSNLPVTLCHELSHLKGNIYEDQANFIGYLACEGSESKLFRYSAYLSVIYYVERDLKANLTEEEYALLPAISDTVVRDRVFLTPETWEQVESSSPLNTETVHSAANAFLETNLTANGVKSGTASYGEVVRRLLEYYDGILY